ncbi:MAG: hypothetical protein ACI8QQ_002991 [Psychroserpens sp.]|jgi:hypothetical protein
MKTINNVIIVAFISILTFACNSDDDSTDGTIGDNQAKIIGAWRYASGTTNGVADTLDDCELMDTVTFTSSQVTFTYFEGVDCADTGSETISYTISDNTITITFDGESYTSEIITLNNTTLTLKDTEDDEVYTDTYIKI